MEQVEVEILTQAVTQQYGVLSKGDILRTDAVFAKHLVDDCGAAKYVHVKPVEPRDPQPKPLKAAKGKQL